MDAATAMPAPHASGRRTSVVGEVLAVLRLAFTMRVDAARIVGRDATIALLGAAALAVWVGLGLTDVAGAAQPRAAGFAELSAVAAAVLALAWVTARVARPALPIRQVLWLVAGYLPAATAVGWLLTQNLSRAAFVAIASVASAHAAAYFWFGLRALRGGSPWRPFAALLAGVCGCIALYPGTRLDFTVWSVRMAPDQLADYRESVRRTEELMYLQPGRIEAALSGLAVDDGDDPRIYFVGFAGFGPQKVFSEEIQLAARLIDERYGTDGRRVLLVNDRRDFDSHPLATRTALARTLAGIGKRMDRERDILFLALSSHGKKGKHLVVENGALPLDPLTAKELAQMLRDSGIRWKVLVISACYAGAFIEPLRDPYTVIITAARPDRSSFGCNDRRALTYFGEAFYRDALPAAASLRQAFETAARDIARRERAQGLKPSEPQAWFGADIERKLAELEAARLRRDPGPVPVEGIGEAEQAPVVSALAVN
jgi:hypothetical protein